MLHAFPLLYFALVIGIGLARRRSATDESEFYLARRSGGTLLLSGSLVATILGAFGVMGLSGMAYQLGLVAGWYLWGGAVGLVILGGWGLRRLEVSDVYTLPEWLGRGYGEPSRRIAAALIVVAWLGVIAAQLIAAGKIFHFMVIASEWSPQEWGSAPFVVAVTCVFVAYTCLGGQRSILRTDLIQAAFIIVALVALVFAALRQHPGALSLVDADLVKFPFSAKMPWTKWLVVMLTFGVPFLVGPDIYSRIYAGRDRKTARSAVLIVSALIIPIVLLVVLVGVLATVAVPDGIQAGETVIFAMARVTLSPVWAGLLMAALLAAVMSSADTCLLTVSTLVCRDVLPRSGVEGARAVRRGRWVVVLAGIASLVVALYVDGIVDALSKSYRLYSPAMLLPVLALMACPRRRFHRLTGIVAIVLGAGIAFHAIVRGDEALQLIAFAAPGVPLAFDFLLRGRATSPNRELPEVQR